MKNRLTAIVSRARAGLLRHAFTWVAVLTVAAALSCERGAGVEMAEAQTASETTGAGAELTEGPNYTISHPALAIAPDASGQLTLSVTPRNDFKINVEYPWLLRLTSPDALSIQRLEWDVTAMERLTEDEARFTVPIAAGQVGRHQIDGHLRFSVCNDVRCDTPQAEVSWSVTVQ